MRALLLLVAVIAVALSPAFVGAQEWPEISEEQRWDRMSWFGTLGLVAAIRYAKDSGATVEEFSEWYGGLMAQSWGEPGRSPQSIMRGMRRNHISWSDGTAELVSDSESGVTARWNRPWVEAFGEDGMWYGVTLEEYEQVFDTFIRAVADRHNLDVSAVPDGDDLLVTFSRR